MKNTQMLHHTGVTSMSSEFGKNQATADALDSYLLLEKPEFAALITGNWGSGKTWFVEKYLEYAKAKEPGQVEKEVDQDQPDGEKTSDQPAFCYVSLFSITDSKEIDAALMTQMNPIFYSEKARFFGRFARFALERASSILPVNVKSNDISTCMDFFKNLCCHRPKKFVVVLDDLERTRLSPKIVLGYVSDLLKEADAKVILICSENNLSEQHNKIFLNFREKVVGMTLSIEPDIESVFNSSLKIIKNTNSNDNLKKFIINQKQNIIDIFNLSQDQNLRHIKRIITEFSRVFHSLSDAAQKNSEYLTNLLKYICIFSIGINSRKLILDESGFIEYTNANKDKIKNKMSSLDEYLQRYTVSSRDISLSLDFVKEFFYKGIIIKEHLINNYNTSIYNKNKDDIPVPLQLWNLSHMNDNDVEDLYETMKKELEERKYTSPGIILHAFSDLLLLNRYGFEEKKKKDIVIDAENYIKDIHLTIDVDDVKAMNNYMPSYKSLGFHEENTEEFKKIYQFIKNKTNKTINKEKTKSIIKSFECLQGSVNNFIRMFPFDYNKYIDKHLDFSGITSENTTNFVSSLANLQNKEFEKAMN